MLFYAHSCPTAKSKYVRKKETLSRRREPAEEAARVVKRQHQAHVSCFQLFGCKQMLTTGTTSASVCRSLNPENHDVIK